jgi:hypothetical protein
MTETNSRRTYTLEQSRFADRCHVDSEGYLHTGSGSAHIDSITITYQDTR